MAVHIRTIDFIDKDYWLNSFYHGESKFGYDFDDNSSTYKEVVIYN